MIEITISQMLQMVPILKQLTEKSFDGVITFKIVKLIKKIEKELDSFNVAYEKIVDKYKTKKNIVDENLRQIQDEKIDIFNKELEELLNLKIKLNIEKIPEEVFESIKITPNQAFLIQDIIE